ncbi:uncharacterized protein LOC119670163 [Teleopsis dalmanni]|uniref:uncharacterized protein LOC119670163 n=1 Tax=Teleopsis dalmanni TaxID=139649 RepID=UPI0018CE214E|nr:uncharacterized protein LOC119670163 [Teleopsis dalmanni]XP_037936256.1 uncharacterized protein LOC119670163 [Teleopsis dalmanni]
MDCFNKEEEFCRYLCSELKKVKQEETFDDLKIEILQLVTSTIKTEKSMLKNTQKNIKRQNNINYTTAKRQNLGKSFTPIPISQSTAIEYLEDPLDTGILSD